MSAQSPGSRDNDSEAADQGSSKEPWTQRGMRAPCQAEQAHDRQSKPQKSQSRTYRTGSGVAEGLLEHSEETTVAHLAVALDKFKH